MNDQPRDSRDPTPSSTDRSLRWHSRRSPHRMRSHREAHAQPEQPHEPPALDHPLVPRHDPSIVTDDSGLATLIQLLRSAGRFAYDSEFIGEHSYHPKLCVIQVATPQGVTLIDPLAGSINLEPFWRLLADASVQKIVHAGMPDLEPVYRHLQQSAHNIFDTQIAAAFANMKYPVGLAMLVKTLTGADLAQGSKFSQWDNRPLSRVQLRYAANDVRYLPLIHALLIEQLQANGNLDWAIQECDTLSDVDLYRFDMQTQRLRVRDMESLRPRQRAVLAALIQWREQAARTEDIPARTLLKDGLLVDLARWPAHTVEELNRVKGFPRPVKQAFGPTIIQTIAAALNERVPDDLKREQTPRSRRYDRDADRPVIDALWNQMHERAAARGIDTGIVASKKDIARWRAAIITAPDQVPQTHLNTGWRRELLGSMFDANPAPAPPA